MRWGSATVASARTSTSSGPEAKLPTGTSNWAESSVSATSPMDRPKAARRSGLTSTRSTFWRSPKSTTSATPSTAVNSVAMASSTSWVSSSMERSLLQTVTSSTGSASCSDLTTNRSSTPSGRRFSTRLTASRTSLEALARSREGLNSTRMRKLPSSEEVRTDSTPATRATAPSTSEATSASMVVGEAPG